MCSGHTINYTLEKHKKSSFPNEKGSSHLKLCCKDTIQKPISMV